jgi:hypothetical protein
MRDLGYAASSVAKYKLVSLHNVMPYSEPLEDAIVCMRWLLIYIVLILLRIRLCPPTGLNNLYLR